MKTGESIINTKPFFEQPFEGIRSVRWHSPSNIALVKYWGKYGDQLPRNPSLSFSLKNSYTDLKLNYRMLENGKGPSVELLFEGKPHRDFQMRVAGYLQKIAEIIPFINQLYFYIDSSNTFPHSAGIASSASSMSALALALCSIENDHFKTLENEHDFFRKASWLARLGSGSASRSVYGGFSIWGKTQDIEASADEYAIPYQPGSSNLFSHLRDAILIVNSQPKAISSSFGHKLMEHHPFAEARFAQASKNLESLVKAIDQAHYHQFIRIIEAEAMQLHALMMSSDPSYLLLEPESIAIIQKIKSFRQQNGKGVCYTVDAGPNIHVLYPAEIDEDITEFIENDLVQHCENQQWISDEIGTGPRRKK
ncbi:MAG: hypothetical protein K9I94_09940 [Bacteroidales bacterium]|nr:hypothetical protein [Bacteroidales bacterium]